MAADPLTKIVFLISAMGALPLKFDASRAGDLGFLARNPSALFRLAAFIVAVNVGMLGSSWYIARFEYGLTLQDMADSGEVGMLDICIVYANNCLFHIFLALMSGTLYQRSDEVRAAAAAREDFARRNLGVSHVGQLLLHQSRPMYFVVVSVGVLPVLASVFYGLATHTFYTRLDVADTGSAPFWILVVLASSSVTVNLCNPFIAGFTTLGFRELLVMSNIVREWRIRALTSEVEDKGGRQERVRKALDQGREVCRLVAQFNKVHSCHCAINYCFMFLGAATFSYGAAAPLVTSFTATRSYYFVGNHLVACAFVLEMVFFCHAGQRVIDEAAAARADLEAAAGSCYGQLGDDVCYGVRCLARRLQNLKISPFGAFDLSHSSFLSLFGLTLTYMIVLLQFMNNSYMG